MAMTAKTFTSLSTNSMDLSSRVSQTSVLSNSTSKLSESYSNSNTNKNENFKSVLSSTTFLKEKDKPKVDERTDNEDSSKVNEVNVGESIEKLKKLEDDSKSESKDAADDVLNELLNLLAQLGIKEEDLKSNGQINQNVLKDMLDRIKKEESPNDAMKKINELLKNDSLKTINNILSNLSTKLSDDKSEISDLLNNKKNQSDKTLTLNDILDKNYSLNQINLAASKTATNESQEVTTVTDIPIDEATFADDLIKNVKFMINNSLKESTVKVNPGNLGEITIKLVEENGVVKANLEANSKEVTVLLIQNLGDIKEKLSEQNIKVSDVNIEFNQNYTNFLKRLDSEWQFTGDQNKQNSNFQNKLSTSATFSKEKNTQKVYETTNNQASTEANYVSGNKLNEILKKLEDYSKSESKDTANNTLTELVKLLAQFGIKEEDLKSNAQMNYDSLKAMLDKIGTEPSYNNVMNKDSLKIINNILNNLGTKFEDDKYKTVNGIKNLMSEIANVLDNKQNQTDKALTFDEMLNKNYSQDNSESSTEDNKKGLSKEEKFLNSLIDDKKDDSLNKINIFASRASTIQNQGANITSRGLAINKATFADDLIKDVKFMSTNSLKELTVKINPGNLGEITIKLVQEDGLMKANLKANSKETTALLSQNLADIKKQLSEQNIKVSDVNIELYQDDTTFFKEQGFEGRFAGEQNKQNSNSQSRMSTAQGIASEELNENLAEENNNVNFFA